MRKLLFITLAAVVASMFLATGCTDKKPVMVDTTGVDSIAVEDTLAVDSIENIIAATPMPKAADELFDDFFFNFAANSKLQLKRIQFPLKNITNGNESELQHSQWKTDNFFMPQGFYTLILDNAKQIKLTKDTKVGNVIVEKINLQNNTLKQYCFDRIEGQWMMTKIVTSDFESSGNSSFLSFYQKFATDSTFQHQSLNSTIQYSGPDPDDDFSTMTGEIEPSSWSAFAPQLPTDIIYNITYGQPNASSNQKVLVFRGIANGFETELTFNLVGGKWKLVKLQT